MTNFYLVQTADGLWYRGEEPESWRKKPELCDPMAEILALTETNLSFLVSYLEDFQAEVRPLLVSPRYIESQQFISFRKRVFDFCDLVKKENALLGRLAEAYLKESKVFSLMEDEFDYLYKTEKGTPPIWYEEEDENETDRKEAEDEEIDNSEEEFLELACFDAFDVLDAMRKGAELPNYLLHSQIYCEIYLAHMVSNPSIPFPVPEYLEVPQVFCRSAEGIFRYSDDIHQQYTFHSPLQYYRFLLVLISNEELPVARCAYCGGYFSPSSKNNTKYCDRIQRRGRSCRQLGPAASHRKEALGDPVIETFDRVKRRMYKRMERFLYGMCTPDKALDAKAYYAWLEAAEDARNQYRAGMLCQEEALRIIDPDADAMASPTSVKATSTS